MIMFLLSLDCNGYFRNDAIVHMKTKNDFNFYNINELKLCLNKKKETWMLYSDSRIFYYYGNIFDEDIKISIKRSFLRLFLWNFNLTFGKQYISLGLPVILNPFEIDRAISFIDLNYTKEGIIAFSSEMMINPKSGFKFFVIPQLDLKNSNYGFDIYTNLNLFDFGVVFTGMKDIFSTGFYLKGDAFLGINTSNKINYNRISNENTLESLTGFDYSILDGKIFFNSSLYYSSVGNSYLLNSRKILYNFLNYDHNEFLVFSIVSFTNIDDKTTIFIPQLTYTYSQGLSVIFSLMLPYGNGTFSQENFGRLLSILRIEGRF